MSFTKLLALISSTTFVCNILTTLCAGGRLAGSNCKQALASAKIVEGQSSPKDGIRPPVEIAWAIEISSSREPFEDFASWNGTKRV